VGETLRKTPAQFEAAEAMAAREVKSPLNSWAPAVASCWAAAEDGSRTSAWTFWPAARRARATAPPWEPVAPVMRKVWGGGCGCCCCCCCGCDMAIVGRLEFVDMRLEMVLWKWQDWGMVFKMETEKWTRVCDQV
jgi:hypothetical protein